MMSPNEVKHLYPGKIEIFLAKLFGKKEIMDDAEGLVEFYVWRKKFYVTKVIERDEHENIYR